MSAPEAPTGTPDRWRRYRLAAPALLFLILAAAILELLPADDASDVPGMPGATVWAKSHVEGEGEDMSLVVDASAPVARDGADEARLSWFKAASQLQTELTLTGDPESAPQSVSGEVTYVVPRERWNWLRLRRVTELVPRTYRFTGESTAGEGGVRWWRLERVDPVDDGSEAGRPK